MSENDSVLCQEISWASLYFVLLT